MLLDPVPPSKGREWSPPYESAFRRQVRVAQRIEHLTTDQEVGGSSPSTDANGI